MILHETFKLSNGVTIPKLGLGTWFIADDKAAQAVCDAVAIGYRHIDTAQAYENERGVGEGVRSCGVPRDELFVTTKLRAEFKSYAASKTAIDGSLRDLGLDHIDLMIIHSPQPWAKFKEGEHFFEGNLEAWRALEDAYKAGKLRAIGVSNFDPVDVDNLIENGSIRALLRWPSSMGSASHSSASAIALNSACCRCPRRRTRLTCGKMLPSTSRSLQTIWKRSRTPRRSQTTAPPAISRSSAGS
jgi:hypothetical protein